METSELKEAKSEIKRVNDELERRVIDRTRQLAAANEEMRKEMIERQRAEEALLESQAELARVTRALDMGEVVCDNCSRGKPTAYSNRHQRQLLLASS